MRPFADPSFPSSAAELDLLSLLSFSFCCPVTAPYWSTSLPAFISVRILLSSTRSTFRMKLHSFLLRLLLRKEVIQPQVLLRLPCYDFTPITSFTFGGVLLAVRLPTSGPPGSHGVTGGVYKARERIHRGMLIHDY